MTVIVTMAGAGSRFSSQGYKLPKYMIRARGKTLFEWSMESLREFFNQHFIFACLAEHDASWIKSQAEALGIVSAVVVQRSKLSSGQAETAYDVLNHANSEDEVWIYNIDTYIEKVLLPSDMDGYDGCAHVFESQNSGMSFVRFDEDGKVVELAEKRVISNWATIGIYGFSSATLYGRLYEQAYLAGEVKEVSGERYVAPMYQLLLADGRPVCAPKLKRSAVHILGTPQQVLDFDPMIKPPYGS